MEVYLNAFIPYFLCFIVAFISYLWGYGIGQKRGGERDILLLKRNQENHELSMEISKLKNELSSFKRIDYVQSECPFLRKKDK